MILGHTIGTFQKKPFLCLFLTFRVIDHITDVLCNIPFLRTVPTVVTGLITIVPSLGWAEVEIIVSSMSLESCARWGFPLGVNIDTL